MGQGFGLFGGVNVVLKSCPNLLRAGSEIINIILGSKQFQDRILMFWSSLRLRSLFPILSPGPL